MRANFNERVATCPYEYLQKASLIQGAVHQSEQTLVSYIRPVVFQLLAHLRDNLLVVIAVE
jgi:hypothetical protein